MMMRSVRKATVLTVLWLCVVGVQRAQAYRPEGRVVSSSSLSVEGTRALSTRPGSPATRPGLQAMFGNKLLLADASLKARPNGLLERIKNRYGTRTTRFGRLVRRLTHTPPVVTADEAAKELGQGDRVYMQIGHGAPHAVVGALVKESHQRQSRYSDENPLVIVGLTNTASRKLFTMKEDYRGRIVPEPLFIGVNARAAVAAGLGRAVPIHLGEIPRAFREKRIPLDAAVVKVSPPDSRGFVTLGPSIATAPAAIESVRLVIGEINKHVPETNGAARIHVSQLDKLVHDNTPLVALPENKIGRVEQAIADHVITQVIKKHLPKEGLLGTFQFGIGGIPDAIAAGLVKMGRKVRVRSEMIADGVRVLEQAGLVDGTVDYTFYMGTEKGLKWLHRNPRLRAFATEAINDSGKLGKIKNFVAINGAVEVDLFGAVNAQMVNNEWYSGVGGQRDFMLGAKNSKGGLAITTLPSTQEKRNGDVISTIVWPWALGENNEGLRFEGPNGETLVLRGKQPATTTSMHDVMFVATEHGVADLTRSRYLSVDQRMEALIKIADPRFRPKLRELLERQQREGLEQAIAKQEAHEAQRAAKMAAKEAKKHPLRAAYADMVGRSKETLANGKKQVAASAERWKKRAQEKLEQRRSRDDQ